MLIDINFYPPKSENGGQKIKKSFQTRHLCAVVYKSTVRTGATSAVISVIFQDFHKLLSQREIKIKQDLIRPCKHNTLTNFLKVVV